MEVLKFIISAGFIAHSMFRERGFDEYRWKAYINPNTFAYAMHFLIEQGYNPEESEELIRNEVELCWIRHKELLIKPNKARIGGSIPTKPPVHPPNLPCTVEVPNIKESAEKEVPPEEFIKRKDVLDILYHMLDDDYDTDFDTGWNTAVKKVESRVNTLRVFTDTKEELKC